MQNQASFQEQCDTIIAWRTKNLSPQALFELPEVVYLSPNDRPLEIKYTEEQIKKNYKRLALKFYPDKNPLNKDRAEQAFDVIKEAQDYLLYTIQRNVANIATNEFYLYYHRNTIGNRTKEDKIEGMIREGYRLKEGGQDMRHLVRSLSDNLAQNRALIHYECDSSNLLNFRTGGKSILYAAAQWNEPTLFSWLIENGADPVAKTIFGVSPLDIAITSNHREILRVLASSSHFGADSLKTEMEKLFRVNDNSNADSLLQFYIEFFKDDFVIDNFMTQFPLMIPALHHLNYLAREQAIPLYKKTIIGRPELYRYLNEKERADLFILIATLAQDRRLDTLMYIPQDPLTPGLITALCEFWPDLEFHFNQDTTNPSHWRQGQPRGSTLPNFQNVQYALLGTVICIAMLVLAYHFWPIIALWPEILLKSIVMPIGGALIGLGAGGLMISTQWGYDYATKVYPETRAIQKLLIENNFFKVTTPHRPERAPTEELTDSDNKYSEPTA